MFTKKIKILNLNADRLLFRVIGFVFTTGVCIVFFSFKTFKSRTVDKVPFNPVNSDAVTILFHLENEKEKQAPKPKNHLIEKVKNDVFESKLNLNDFTDLNTGTGFNPSILPNKVFDEFEIERIILNLEIEKSNYKFGEDALHDFIQQNIIYPNTMMMLDLEGIVTVNFFVKPNGQIEILSTDGDANLEFIIEAKRILMLTSGNWIPSKYGKKYIKSVCKIPISFEIN